MATRHSRNEIITVCPTSVQVANQQLPNFEGISGAGGSAAAQPHPGCETAGMAVVARNEPNEQESVVVYRDAPGAGAA